MRTRLSILLVLVVVSGLLMAAPTATAHHWDGYSPIIPFGSQHHGGETIEATVGDTLEFGARWGTCTKGLAQSYASNAEVDVWVDGVELEPAGWSQPINPDYEISDFSFEDGCMSNAYADAGWWVFWKAPVTFTEPGDFTVTVEVTHTEEIHDGAGTYIEAGQTFWGEVFVHVALPLTYPLILPAWPNGETATLAAGQVLADELSDVTGEDFSVVVADGPREMYELMCSFPGSGVGIMNSLGYGLASLNCGAEASFKAVRFGYDSYWSQFLVPRDSTTKDISKLDHLSWAYSDVASLSAYVVPMGMMAMEKVKVGESFPTRTHYGAVRAVYDGGAGFGTTYFSPPWIPDGEWQQGVNPPDIPNDVVATCGWGVEGLFCGDDDEWRVLDPRADNNLRDLLDVVQQVRILAISPPIPNDAVVFGAQFPAELRVEVEEALVGLADENGPNYEIWEDSVWLLYMWDSINPAADADWDWFREAVIGAAGFSIDDL